MIDFDRFCLFPIAVQGHILGIKKAGPMKTNTTDTVIALCREDGDEKRDGEAAVISKRLEAQEMQLFSLRHELGELREKVVSVRPTIGKSASQDFTYKEVVRNLEGQVDALSQELQTENEMRVRLEDELKLLQDEVNFYKEADTAEAMGQQMRRLKEHHEGLLAEDTGALGLRSVTSDAKSSTLEKVTPRSPTPTIRKENRNNGRTMVEELQVELAELQLLYDGATRKEEDLQKKLAELEKRYKSSCQMVNEAFQKVSEAVELAQNAANERDMAISEKSTVESELQSLKQVFEKLIDEAGQRTREEVEKVRNQANDNIAKLLDELHRTEQERTQIALELDRLRKDSASEAITTSISEDPIETKIEGVLQRAHRAEEERDELKLRLETSRLSHERAISSKETEIHRLLDEKKLLQERLECASIENSTTAEKLRCQLESMRQSESQAVETKRQSEAAQRSAVHEVQMAKQALEIQERESARRVEALETANQNSIKRWQELLGKQQKLAEKWKSEAMRLADELEQQSEALTTEVNSQKRRADKLARRVEYLEQNRPKMLHRVRPKQPSD
ncbi:unnamed protein product [Calicophoron daubneyi]|uniref:Uncharacterized protein n=1 Tax=Calicophoron daubneyi TaxID=300641 RepID=A0AAV2TB25_CALDB